MLYDGIRLIDGPIINARIEQVSAFPTIEVVVGRIVYLTTTVGSNAPGLYCADATNTFKAVGSGAAAAIAEGTGIKITTANNISTISIDPAIVVMAATLGVANGVATLDANGTVPLSQISATLLGGVHYISAWNASTNTPTLASGVGTKGAYYTVSVGGTRDLDGSTIFKPGDLVMFNGTTWDKIDGAQSEVVTVAGRIGAVVLATSDITEDTKLFYTDARARTAISVTGTGLSYDSSTGIITSTASGTATAQPSPFLFLGC